MPQIVPFTGELEEDESTLKVGMKLRFTVEHEAGYISYKLAVDAFGRFIL